MLKPTRKAARRAPPDRAAAPGPMSHSQPGRTPSPGRKWAFRLIAILVLPLLVLSVVEAGLRLGGYGHATSFFIPRLVNGRAMLVENTWFGLRFFPPALARSPAPLSISAVKEPGVFRIFLFGESAALGDPRPAYGMGRYLEVLLAERFPGKRFEVICVAMTAINSHAVLRMARECARLEGDLWVVYMGNNEFAGPFGANTVFGPRALRRATVRAYLAIERLRLGQLALALTRKARADSSRTQSWGGLKMFLDSELPPSDPRKGRVYSNFRDNVDAIVRAAQRAKVPVVLSSVASNLKDCAPFASAQRPSSASGSKGEVAFRSGLAEMEQGHRTEALARFQEAALVEPEDAAIHYELARCLAALQQWAAARQQFILARDLDALPFRADSTLNRIIQEAASDNAKGGVSYVDAEQVLAAPGPLRLPGQESFLEHVHLRPEGNYRLARAFAEAIEAQLPEPDLQRTSETWATEEVCAQRLGLTDWNRYSMLEEILQRLDEPPFTSQSHHAERVGQLSAELHALKTRMGGNALAQARAAYADALQRRPADHWLHHSYAEFLKSIGDLPAATIQMEQVRDLLPHHYAAYLQLGRLLARQKKNTAAREALAQAAAIRPDLAEIYVELGQLDVAEGKLDQALQHYAQAQRYRPDDPATWLLKAKVFDQQNKTADAIQCLREAVRLHPNQWESRYQLALHLSVEHQFAAAESELRAVLQLRPSEPAAHLNLGFVLARQNRFDQALAEFRETLRLDPANAQARQFLQTIEELKSRASGDARPIGR